MCDRNMKTDSFSTAEDELNFILGTDGKTLFDIDNVVPDDVEDVMPPVAPAANDSDGNRDLPLLPFAVSGTARPTAASAFMTDMADDFGHKAFAPIHNTISRMGSLSPPPPSDHVYTDFSEPLFLNEQPTTSFAPQDLDDFQIDFNFDLANEMLPSIAPKYFSGPFVANDACVSDLQRRLSYQDQLNPFVQDQGLPPPPPYNANHAPNSKKWAALSNYPPIVHPAQLSTVPKRPFRKRKVEDTNLIFIPPSPTSVSQTLEGIGPIESPPFNQGDSPEVAREKATKARNARKMRRSKRAKSQAIILSCRVVTEIERIAVLDSDYSRLSPQSSDVASLEQDLLNDFSRNFNPQMFVDLTWDQVYENLIEASEAREVDAIISCIAEVNSLIGIENLPSSQPIQDVPEPIQDIQPDPDTSLTATPSVPNEVEETSSVVVTVTPLKEGNRNLNTLPSGKDPESRRLRQLMRNRLSAQASRDRRKKAIEDMKKQKVVKEEEMALLEKTVSEEIQRMELLKKAASYAREYLGPQKYSKVAGHFNTIHRTREITEISKIVQHCI